MALTATLRSWAARLGRRDAQLARQHAAALGVGLPLPNLRVCAGIVTYDNAPPQLERALRSLHLAAIRAGCTLSVLMLDNAGPSSAAVRDLLTAAPLATQGNVGFGAAQNRLIARAFADGADAYLALNPDAALHPNCLEALLRMHQASAGRALIEGLQFPDEFHKFHDHLNFVTQWASAACLLLPRSVYDTVGGFDPGFFMYCEDVDLSWRARAAGFAVKTCVPALVFHPLGGRVPDLQTHRRFLTSALRLALKWDGVAFSETVREKMREFGLEIPDFPDLVPLAAPPGIADFSRGLSFARTRW